MLTFKFQASYHVNGIKIIVKKKKKKSATQVLLSMLTRSSIALGEYEIQMFPQQNLSWLKFSFGRALYYGNETEEYFFSQLRAWCQAELRSEPCLSPVKECKTTGGFLTH